MRRAIISCAPETQVKRVAALKEWLGDDQHDNAVTFGSHYVRGLYATTSSDRHLLHQEVMPLWWMSPYGTFATCGRKRASASIQKAVVSSSAPHTL